MCIRDSYTTELSANNIPVDMKGDSFLEEYIAMDPEIDPSSWSQVRPFPSCNELSRVGAELESFLLSGVVTGGCDLTNLSIEDFALSPDPFALTIDDLNFIGKANSCFVIEIEVVYTDPCGTASAPVIFVIQVGCLLYTSDAADE